jgi:hypothetical protein
MRLAGVRFGALHCSSWTGFEAPDPLFWSRAGYAVIQADVRGMHKSEGHAGALTDDDAHDYYEFIEWAARQPWSTGAVGLVGVWYLAMSQWRVAALLRSLPEGRGEHLGQYAASASGGSEIARRICRSFGACMAAPFGRVSAPLPRCDDWRSSFGAAVRMRHRELSGPAVRSTERLQIGISGSHCSASCAGSRNDGCRTGDEARSAGTPDVRQASGGGGSEQPLRNKVVEQRGAALFRLHPVLLVRRKKPAR